ncbi:hypothetical protein FXO37_04594 [Capsicum annuum]|nr:hypothetical protein FXO37_04594 [Capsicum annuum]
MIVKKIGVDFDYGVDLIVSISRNVDLNDDSWFEIENSIDVKLQHFKIPQNVYRALLQVYVSFNENDESWYGNSINEKQSLEFIAGKAQNSGDLQGSDEIANSQRKLIAGDAGNNSMAKSPIITTPTDFNFKILIWRIQRKLIICRL